MNYLRTISSLLVLCLLPLLSAHAQQIPDMTFNFVNNTPNYTKSGGPVVRVDAEHSPYVQRKSFDPFIKLIKADGFQVDYLNTKITPEILSPINILVIVNAYKKNFRKFSVMEPPSAYEPDEISAINNWVRGGGRLLLIADHAPLTGGSIKLAETFGFTFFNSYVLKKSIMPRQDGHIDYRSENGLNLKSPIFDAKFGAGSLDHFYTFTGSVFIAPDEAISVLSIPEDYVALLTHSIRKEANTAPQIKVSGLPQGATMEFGKGRLAVFAEAGSFSAQTINNSRKMGMNSPVADQNPQFVLATMQWLAEGL